MFSNSGLYRLLTAWVLGIGIWPATIALTVLTVTMAVLLDLTLQQLTGGPHQPLEVWLTSSILIPALITPPIGLLVISMAYELAAAKSALADAALTDPLTGIANRRFFVVQAEIEIARARRLGAPLSVLVVDVDHFKEINDTYGHGVGDQVLQLVVATCLGALRAGDSFSRFGGDEFVALLPGASADIAVGVAQKLCDIVQALDLRPVGPRSGVTLSIGVAALPPEGGTWQCMIEAADRNLYIAKTTGRNRPVGGQADPARAAS